MLARLVALLTVCSAAIGCGSNPSANQAPRDEVHDFKLSATAETTIHFGGKSGISSSETTHLYAWSQSNKQRTMTSKSITMRAAANGRELMNVRNDRTGMFGTQNGASIRMEYENAPDEVQRMLRGTFGPPLCTIMLDSAGNEISRTADTAQTPSGTANAGLIATTLLVHPPYPSGQNTWSANAGLGCGVNGLVTGSITYTKSGEENGKTTVKIAGVLTADEAQTGMGITGKDLRYVLSGTQQYDAEIGEWVSGSIDVDLTFTMSQKNMMATATGKMKLTFEMEKK